MRRLGRALLIAVGLLVVWLPAQADTLRDENGLLGGNYLSTDQGDGPTLPADSAFAFVNDSGTTNGRLEIRNVNNGNECDAGELVTLTVGGTSTAGTFNAQVFFAPRAG